MSYALVVALMLHASSPSDPIGMVEQRVEQVFPGSDWSEWGIDPAAPAYVHELFAATYSYRHSVALMLADERSKAEDQIAELQAGVVAPRRVKRPERREMADGRVVWMFPDEGARGRAIADQRDIIKRTTEAIERLIAIGWAFPLAASSDTIDPQIGHAIPGGFAAEVIQVMDGSTIRARLDWGVVDDTLRQVVITGLNTSSLVDNADIVMPGLVVIGRESIHGGQTVWKLEPTDSLRRWLVPAGSTK